MRRHMVCIKKDKRILKALIFLLFFIIIFSLINAKKSKIYASNAPLYKTMSFRVCGAPVGSIIEIYMIDDTNKNRHQSVITLLVRENYQVVTDKVVPSFRGDYEGGTMNISGSAKDGYVINFNEVNIHSQTPWLRISGTVLKGFDVSSAMDYGVGNNYLAGPALEYSNPVTDGSTPVNANGELNKYVGMSFNAEKIVYNCREHNYNIIYDGNGATTGNTNSQTTGYTKSLSLAQNQFGRNGYTFMGWNSSPDGNGKTYRQGQVVSQLSEVDGAIIRLYAMWEPIKYKVRFYPDKPARSTEELNIKSPTGYKRTDEYFEKEFTYNKKENIASPEVFFGIKGWRGISWIRKIDGITVGTGWQIWNLTDVNDEVVELYASWGENIYNINLDCNGGYNLDKDKFALLYENRIKLPKASNRPGFKFAGWNTNRDGSGDVFIDEADIYKLRYKNDDTVTLYAMWDKRKGDIFLIDTDLGGRIIYNNTAMNIVNSWFYKSFQLRNSNIKLESVKGDYTVTKDAIIKNK